MIVDSEQQRRALLNCIQITASSVRVDASDESLAGHTAIVHLRHAVEAATVAEAHAQADA